MKIIKTRSILTLYLLNYDLKQTSLQDLSTPQFILRYKSRLENKYKKIVKIKSNWLSRSSKRKKYF